MTKMDDKNGSCAPRLRLTRRVLVTRTPIVIAGSELLGTFFDIPNSEAGTSSRVIATYGDVGGRPFEMQYPDSIGLRAAGWLDAIIINGNTYGCDHCGNAIDEVTINTGDYWNEIEVWWHNRGPDRVVHFVRFGSKNGAHVEGGVRNGDNVTLQDIYILRLGGRAQDAVDNIKLEYISNYQPSTVVDADATAVLDMKTGGQTISEYKETNIQIAQAYQKTTESITEANVNASAEGQYYAKFAASTGLKTVETTKEDVKFSVEQALKSGEKIEQTISPDQAAFLISSVTIMKDSEGHPWMYPNASPNWITLDKSQFSRLIGYYDLTGGTATQTGLKTIRKNGYRNLIAAK